MRIIVFNLRGKNPAETKENIRNYLLELTEFERDLVKQKKKGSADVDNVMKIVGELLQFSR